MNEYFVPGSVPAPNSPGSSAAIRAEFSSIATAFDKLPVLAGSANEFVTVNATGTALIASGFLFSDFVTLSGAQTLTNKTLAWADNTWLGFESGATKVAGTAADNVLLLAENAKLPALDGSQLTNLTPAALGIVPLVNGGTGASDLVNAQANLGINLKADANNAVLTGAPTCPTPPVGNSSARLANTQFVTDTITAIGAAIPSDATPLMDGVAAAGTHNFVSRDDHVHPTDTTRAPASAGTAAGTRFTPAGGVAATNVQAAISELDSEKAPIASPTLTGTPATTTPLTSDNSTRIASTAFVQSLLAQQPPGVEVSDSAPLMNGTVAPGTGVEASRYDHVHPTDTSRAPIASPSFTGTVTAPQRFNVTQSYGALQVAGADVFRFGSDNSGQLAGFRNKIINGDCRISQRGHVAAVNNTWTFGGSDRICFGPTGFTSLSGTIVRGADIENYAFYWQTAAVSTTGSGTISFQTRIEAADTKSLNGKTVTARVRVYHNAGSTLTARITLNKPTTNANVFSAQTVLAQAAFSCPSDAVQDITVTYTLGSQEALLGLAVNVDWLGVGAVTGKTFATTNWQLEEGSIATTQERRPTGVETALCMRYFERQNYSQNAIVVTGTALSNVFAFASLNYFRKIWNPTITITSGIVPFKVPSANAGGTWISELVDVNTARIATTGASGLVAGDACPVFVEAAGQYIDISSEL